MNRDNKQQKLSDSTEPQIAYSECYAQVFLGDCLELYKNLEPKSIDLILTDLPYGTTACKWDTIIPFDKLWEMVNYLLKPNGAFITTASQPFTSALVMSNPKMFKYELIWHKSHPTGFASSKKRTMKYHENILIFYNNQPTYNPQITKGKPNHWNIKKAGKVSNSQPKLGEIENKNGDNKFPNSVMYFNSPNRNGIFHPTQKPIALFEYLLKTYSNENMTVFDPCMGSGTTGVACKNLNRNFIGIEKDENYFKIAEQRINARTLFS